MLKGGPGKLTMSPLPGDGGPVSGEGRSRVRRVVLMVSRSRPRRIRPRRNRITGQIDTANASDAFEEAREQGLI